MVRAKRSVPGGRYHVALVFVLVLLVLLGLNVAEAAFFEYSSLSGPSHFFRFQLPAPGEYRLYCLGQELAACWLWPMVKVTVAEDGFWLQMGTWQLFCPTRIALFTLP